MYLIATNEYLVNIISYIFLISLVLFVPLQTDKNIKNMKKVLLVSLSMLVILPSIRFVANPLYAQQLIMGDSMIILVMRDMFLVCLFLLYI